MVCSVDLFNRNNNCKVVVYKKALNKNCFRTKKSWFYERSRIPLRELKGNPLLLSCKQDGGVGVLLFHFHFHMLSLKSCSSSSVVSASLEEQDERIRESR